MLKWIVYFVLAIVIGLMAFVRFSPTDVSSYHKPSFPATPGDRDFGFFYHVSREITTTPEGLLRAIDTIALDTPRTRQFAGSIEEGMITYETRSLIFGFPDYTVVSVGSVNADLGPVVQLVGRQRFGISDLGVNKARLEDWIAQLGPLIVAPE